MSEVAERIEKRIKWIQRNIAPDDIYMFAEQALMGAEFFMGLWAHGKNLTEECGRCPLLGQWLNNIAGFRYLRDKDQDCKINLEFKVLEHFEDPCE